MNISDVRNLYQLSEAFVSYGILKQPDSHQGILFDHLYDRIIADSVTRLVGLILVCNKFTNRVFVDDFVRMLSFMADSIEGEAPSSSDNRVELLIVEI